MKITKVHLNKCMQELSITVKPCCKLVSNELNCNKW